MNIEEITRKYLAENHAIPEGFVEKFGIHAKEEHFHQYKDLEEMEKENQQFSGKNWGPFAYSEPH